MFITSKSLEEKVREFSQRCRSLGLNLTHQRLAVFKTLYSTTDHPSAEIIYNKLKKEIPTISLATIYKTLELFKEIGEITEVNILRTARFESNIEPHHHLICVECNRIEDIFDLSLNDMAREKAANYSYDIIEGRVEFRGYCPDCTRRKKF